MAVSAVPGSGKTFTLVELAARLIAGDYIEPKIGQQILIVTYLNSSADNFKTRLRERLQQLDVDPVGYDVRTLHSLSLEIVRMAYMDSTAMPTAIDDGQSRYFLGRAIDTWRETNPEAWQSYLPDPSPQMKVRWRDMVEKTARTFIRNAKNAQYEPEVILAQIDAHEQRDQIGFTHMIAEIYANYQTILKRQGAIDFDDQVWLAVSFLNDHPPMTDSLRQRWPYVLEDEAQDSVPLQAALLAQLIGDEGNLVRVGDPNQAITSTFTAAHPRFFTQFLARPDVLDRPLPNSGRNAPIIYNLANELVRWVCADHLVPEVQTNTFRNQAILPTPDGDAQPNPRDDAPGVGARVHVYDHRTHDEIPGAIKLAARYLQKFEGATAAILVPTNWMGQLFAEKLDQWEMEYDSLLKGGARERQVAAALHSLLALLAAPLHKRTLKEAFDALHTLGHPAASDELEDRDRFHGLLLSIHRLENILYPSDGDDDFYRSLPSGIATEQDIIQLRKFATFLRHVFSLRTLPIDALAMTLGDDLFTHDQKNEGDVAIAYGIATYLRTWQDLEPEKRLPDLVAELNNIATGRRTIHVAPRTEEGFEPRPGRITLATQHSAKGLEWDAVFLVGIDAGWIPWSLDSYFQGVYDFLDGDPTAQVAAELSHIMTDDPGTYPGRTPTESAHIDIISERLRLLYVGITRAKRYLQISRSRTVTLGGTDRPVEGSQTVGVLAQHLHYYK